MHEGIMSTLNSGNVNSGPMLFVFPLSV